MQRSRKRPDNDHEQSYQRSDPEDQDDDDLVPLHHKRPFGSGLKRKRVEFVRATDTSDAISDLASSEKSGIDTADIYASIVFQKKEKEQALNELTPGEPALCSTCSLPITTSIEAHNASLAHQVSLQHSHPPSHLDRSRMGLRTLSARGWDPDARVGLGAGGEGMRFPIKVTAKDDTLGIGAAIPEGKKPEPKPKPLTAKEMKERELKEKKRGEKLQRDMYGSADLDKYLTRREEWE